jgi:hypothetical protein
LNLAKIYLQSAYPDSIFTRAHLEELEAAGKLEWLRVLLSRLKAQGNTFSRPDISVIDAAAEIEEQQMAQFVLWREELARKVNNPALLKVELVFVELSTPQAVTIHEQDNSYAIALDRRMTSFLGALTAWAYVGTYLELKGVPARDARLTFLNALSDHVTLAYTKQPPPPNLEARELQRDQTFDEVDRQLTRDAATLAAKFVLFHELGHVHLEHFGSGHANRAEAADTAQVSAFHEHNIELEADAFANQHLIDKDGSLSAAVASTAAASIYLLLLALKEALLPAPGTTMDARAREHPPSVLRADRLALKELPPAGLPQWEVYYQIPTLLKGVYSSSFFQASAPNFARIAGSVS